MYLDGILGMVGDRGCFEAMFTYVEGAFYVR